VNRSSVFVIPPDGHRHGWTVTRREAWVMLRGHPAMQDMIGRLALPVIRLIPPATVQVFDATSDPDLTSAIKAAMQ